MRADNRIRFFTAGFVVFVSLLVSSCENTEIMLFEPEVSTAGLAASRIAPDPCIGSMDSDCCRPQETLVVNNQCEETVCAGFDSFGDIASSVDNGLNLGAEIGNHGGYIGVNPINTCSRAIEIKAEFIYAKNCPNTCEQYTSVGIHSKKPSSNERLPDIAIIYSAGRRNSVSLALNGEEFQRYDITNDISNIWTLRITPDGRYSLFKDGVNVMQDANSPGSMQSIQASPLPENVWPAVIGAYTENADALRQGSLQNASFSVEHCDYLLGYKSPTLVPVISGNIVEPSNLSIVDWNGTRILAFEDRPPLGSANKDARFTKIAQVTDAGITVIAELDAVSPSLAINGDRLRLLARDPESTELTIWNSDDGVNFRNAGAVSANSTIPRPLIGRVAQVRSSDGWAYIYNNGNAWLPAYSSTGDIFAVDSNLNDVLLATGGNSDDFEAPSLTIIDGRYHLLMSKTVGIRIETWEFVSDDLTHFTSNDSPVIANSYNSVTAIDINAIHSSYGTALNVGDEILIYFVAFGTEARSQIALVKRERPI